MLDSIAYEATAGVESKELLPNKKLLLFINTSYSFAFPAENKLVVVKYS